MPVSSLALGQLDAHDNEIIEINKKTALLAMAKYFNKQRLDTIKGWEFTLPDGRLVCRVPLDGLHPSQFRAPRNRQPTPVPFRSTTSQYLVLLSVREAGEAGTTTQGMTLKEKRIVRELVAKNVLTKTGDVLTASAANVQPLS